MRHHQTLQITIYLDECYSRTWDLGHGGCHQGRRNQEQLKSIRIYFLKLKQNGSTQKKIYSLKSGVVMVMDLGFGFAFFVIA